MPAIGAPVMKPMTSAGTIRMNGSNIEEVLRHRPTVAPRSRATIGCRHADPIGDATPVQQRQLLEREQAEQHQAAAEPDRDEA